MFINRASRSHSKRLREDGQPTVFAVNRFEGKKKNENNALPKRDVLRLKSEGLKKPDEPKNDVKRNNVVKRRESVKRKRESGPWRKSVLAV